MSDITAKISKDTRTRLHTRLAPTVVATALGAGAAAWWSAGRADLLPNTTAAIVLVVAGAGMTLAHLLVARLISPIARRLDALAADMAQVAAGNYSQRATDPLDDEVGILVRYFNLMACSLEETDRELTEKTNRLETALQNRQLLDRAKDDFLVLISHEVRTPLTAIMGGVDILNGVVRRAEGGDREALERLNVTEVLKIIESNGRRLRGFMNDAIQMTTIQSSDHQLDLHPERVGTLIEMGLCGVREMAQLREIGIRNELETVDDWQVLCDARILTLAFEKVLKNAVAHNYDGGEVIVREVDAIPGVDDLAHAVQAEDIHRLMNQESFSAYRKLPITWRAIEIYNTGEVIPAERCEALFGKFELVGRIENHQRGSGLSLPIAQAAVQHHGGRISVHGVGRQGNSFTLLLPTVAAGSIEKAGNRLRRRARHLEVGEMGDAAPLEIELDHQPAGTPGRSH
ncbi:HAMP domain-containing histidine kinase [bacterium]|nr:HAMP domain-containing histidine kinase [bacterium]